MQEVVGISEKNHGGLERPEIRRAWECIYAIQSAVQGNTSTMYTIIHT